MALRYAVAIAILLGLFFVVPFEATWTTLAGAQPREVALAALLFTGSRWIGCLRTGRLARRQGLRIGSARLFEISCASTLYGLALPGSLFGGVVRWHRLGALHGSHGEAAGLVGFERLIDYAVLAWIGLVCWLIDPAVPSAPALTGLLWLGALIFSTLAATTLTPLPARLAARLGPAADGDAHQIRGALARMLGVLPRHASAAAVATTVALSFVLHATATVALASLAGALDLGLGLLSLAWLRAFTVVLIAAPLTPAGLGVREVGTVFLLGLLGVSAAGALALSLLQFAMILLFAAIGAALEIRRQLGMATA